MRHRFVLLALALPVFGACSSDKASDSPAAPAVTQAVTTPAVTTADTVATAATGSGAVGIANFKFGPAEVHVAVGGSVVWTNNDTQQHTATSAGNFDAGAIQPGASATVEFKTAGSFTYICSFHPFMMGTVVVG
jgi:plastocyanin